MGEPLYEQVVGKVADGKLNRPCRIYAPVGTHETLLAYLVRRLLENGANTSFVNRIADATLPLDELVADPVQRRGSAGGAAKARLACRIRAFRCRASCTARNAPTPAGLDLANEHRLASLSSALLTSASHPWRAEPIIDAELDQGVEQPVINPAEPGDVVGYVREATEGEVSRALDAAAAAAPIWFATPPTERAAILERAAELMEESDADADGHSGARSG